MRYAKVITKISLCCGILSSIIWQDTIERAVGHYTVSRDYDVTDQECGLSFPDHLPRPRQDGGRKWAGDETTQSLENSTFGAIPRGSGAFAADGLSFTHTRHTWSQRCSSPLAAGAAFVAVAYPFPSKPSNFYAQLDSTCQNQPFTTPPGVS